MSCAAGVYVPQSRISSSRVRAGRFRVYCFCVVAVLAVCCRIGCQRSLVFAHVLLRMSCGLLHALRVADVRVLLVVCPASQGRVSRVFACVCVVLVWPCIRRLYLLWCAYLLDREVVCEGWQ